MKPLLKYKLIVIGLVALNCLGAGNRYREFTSKDGKKIKARILQYDQSTDMVKLEREDRKRFAVKAGAFSITDQRIIRKWDVLKGFLSEDAFRISVKRIEQTVKKAPSRGRMRKSTSKVHYEIVLENRNPYPLKNLRAEWRVYHSYESRSPNTGGRNDQFRELSSRIEQADIASIGPRQKKEYVSEKYDAYHLGVYTDESGGAVLKDSETVLIKGIRVRVHITLEDGTEFMTELCEPEEVWEGLEWEFLKVERGDKKKASP